MTDTRVTTAPTGHPDSCLCVPCMTADMNAHLEAQGIDPFTYGVEATPEPERTRYATPGAACGTGRVRGASDRQKALIRKLLAERDTSNLVRLPGSEDVDRISLRGASDLIDRLFACPELPTAPRSDAPSTKALDFAMVLVERKGLAVTREDLEAKTRKEVSQIIDMMKSLPDAVKEAPAAAPAVEVTEGMYRNPETGEIFKVQRAVHGSGNLYAKLLVVDQAWERDADGTVVEQGEARFVYAPGAIRSLRPEWKMTVEQAQEFGALYGVCCQCSRTLTKEESIRAGIGPKCATKF